MDLLEAYRLIVQAASAGANVTSLADYFNAALGGAPLPPDFQTLAEQAIAEARRAYFLSLTLTAVGLALVFAAAFFAYKYRKTLIGWLWLKIWGRGKLRRGDGKPNTLLFDEEVSAVVVAIAVVAIALAAAYIISPGTGEPFSAIGLLGPQGKIGGYPTAVKVGAPINLYIYVYNHMEAPAWFVVYVKVDNTTAQPPLSSPPVLVMQRLLLNNESWIQPFTVSLNSTGRWRIVAELWEYYPNGTLSYTGRFVQLWVNATR